MATYIGTTTKQLMNGESYPLTTQDMTGLIFAPGKTEDGKRWLDYEGKKDLRVMAYFGNYYHCYNSAEELLKDWEFDEINGHSPRVRKASTL